MLEGFVEPKKEDAEKYVRMGWWQDITLGDVLDKAATLHADKEALIDDRRRLTYSKLREIVDKLAIGLNNLGIKKGDRVMVQLPNWAEFVYTFFALQKIGAPAVLLLPRHMQIEINHLCSLTKAKAWIGPENYRKTSYRPIINDVMIANPHLEHIISVRGGQAKPYISFENLILDTDLSKEDLDKLSGEKPDAAEVAFVLPTGGTTGLPKVVPRTHNSAVCEARYKAEAREQSSNDVCLISVPLEHNLGLAAINSTISSFGKVVLLDSTRPKDLCEMVQREKATCAPLVPTLLTRLLKFDGLEKYDMSSLRALYVGGAKTQPDIIRTIHKNIGKVFVSAFGMSEGPTFSTKLGDNEDIIFDTVGRPCCPHDEFKVVDADGRELPRNTEGELLAKGPGVFFGYLQYPEENKRAFTIDGFFITGDLAVIDDNGNVRITGRMKDIIIRGGENISPVEIESLISAHPDVDDVAVVGIPDEGLGERACAYIKPRMNAYPTLEEIVLFLKSRGASVLQLPERVELIDAIPQTKIGKADKRALREDIKRRLADSSD